MGDTPQTTSLAQLLDDPRESQMQQAQMQQAQMQQMQMQDPSRQFGNLPHMGGNMNAVTGPVTQMMPSGMGQGLSMPDGPTRKEFFGLKEVDWKSIVLVFAIVLILSSGLFSSCVRPYVPGSVGSDGRTTIIGSVIAAILGVLIFVIVKFFGKF